MTIMQKEVTISKNNALFRRLKADRVLYLMIAPTIIYFIIFRVLPITNMRLAFYTFRSRGPWEFAGLKYFKQIFASPAFYSILKNTLIISFMKYILMFPFVVMFAILLNEMQNTSLRRYVQVVSYLPHFLSWVVITGIWLSFLSPSTGAVNQVIGWFGIEAVDFMTNKKSIRWVLALCELWRSIGWDSIIYFAAIVGIDGDLYEAAAIDGAGRLSIIRHIILPALFIPMATMFILNLGFFLNAGFDQVLNFSNDSVLSVIDILDTYIYRLGLINGQYSLATSLGLIKGVVGVFLVMSTHVVSKKITGIGVW
jgi:putative aldouronate transport system permease protein